MIRSFNQILCFFFLFLVLDSKFYNGSNMTTLLLQKAKTTANLEKMLFPNKMQKEESPQNASALLEGQCHVS